MTPLPDGPLQDEDIETVDSTAPGAGGGDGDATDTTDGDASDGGDADGTDA